MLAMFNFNTVILSILSRYRYLTFTDVTQHELDRYLTFTFTLGNGNGTQ